MKSTTIRFTLAINAISLKFIDVKKIRKYQIKAEEYVIFLTLKIIYSL